VQNHRAQYSKSFFSLSGELGAHIGLGMKHGEHPTSRDIISEA
jgi:hypothetical protein